MFVHAPPWWNNVILGKGFVLILMSAAASADAFDPSRSLLDIPHGSLSSLLLLLQSVARSPLSTCHRAHITMTQKCSIWGVKRAIVTLIFLKTMFFFYF
jgi:hypothetical protein